MVISLNTALCIFQHIVFVNINRGHWLAKKGSFVIVTYGKKIFAIEFLIIFNFYLGRVYQITIMAFLKVVFYIVATNNNVTKERL